MERLRTIRAYDLKGRLQSIGSTPSQAQGWGFTYSYNAAGQRYRVECADGSYWIYGYDTAGQLRRANKFWSDHTAVGGQQFYYDYTCIATNLMVYDGWNLIAECDGASGALLRNYGWGLDLSGTMQGAGGIGGLLWAQVPGSATHFPVFDGNGNVMGLVSGTDGTATAHYEYGPFGEVIRQTGPMAKANPFRFSTKYTDEETELVYYGYRYYSPTLGRWLSRDPLNEKGGLNLYGFVNNSPINDFDVLGRQAFNLMVDQIEDALAVGDEEQAAEAARNLYDWIYTGSAFANKPLARKFMGRWLAKIPGRENLTDAEFKGLLKDRYVRGWIGYRLKQQRLKGSGSVNGLPIKDVTAHPPSDYFYALGWFQLKLTGCYTTSGNKVTIVGTWELSDKYDWQDAGDKSVRLLGSRIKDKYAALVENHEYAMPFDVTGKIGPREDTYELLSTPPTVGGRR